MIIAVDYDQTFSAAPELFCSFISNARAMGHCIVCATSRTMKNPIPADAGACFDAVLYCGDKPKRQFALEAGIEVAIWVDDLPETIGSAILVGGAP